MDAKEEDSWKFAVTALYAKYIQPNSPYELNLPFKLRQTCRTVMEAGGSLSATSLESHFLPLVLKIIKECEDLLKDSLQRFATTEDYLRFEGLLKRKFSRFACDLFFLFFFCVCFCFMKTSNKNKKQKNKKGREQ